MKSHYDPWLVRLPDGRTIQAKSTASIRHHVELGHIPTTSLVRRTSNEEWADLTWVAEFADMIVPTARHMRTENLVEAPPVPRSGVKERLDPLRLQSVGIRGFIDEIIAAIDSTLSRSKIIPALATGILLYLGMFLVRQCVYIAVGEPFAFFASIVYAIIALTLFNALITRLTYEEISTMRQVRLRQAARGFWKYAWPALTANLVIVGGCFGWLYFVQNSPEWISYFLAQSQLTDWAQALIYTPALVVLGVMAILLWLMLGLCWLLTATVVLGERGWVKGVFEWRDLIEGKFGRLLVYEGVAMLLGLVITLPLSLAVSLAWRGAPSLYPAPPLGSWEMGGGQSWVTGISASILNGISIGPMLAVMAVANVFIYLNLRYEHHER